MIDMTLTVHDRYDSNSDDRPDNDTACILLLLLLKSIMQQYINSPIQTN